MRNLDCLQARLRAREWHGLLVPSTDEYLGEFGLPGRLYFRKDEGGRRAHQVHAVEHDGEHWHRHRAFRDYLRAHPEEAEGYAAEKRRIAAESRGLEDYWERKQPFADALFARAWAWYSEQR